MKCATVSIVFLVILTSALVLYVTRIAYVCGFKLFKIIRYGQVRARAVAHRKPSPIIKYRISLVCRNVISTYLSVLNYNMKIRFLLNHKFTKQLKDKLERLRHYITKRYIYIHIYVCMYIYTHTHIYVLCIYWAIRVKNK